MAIQMAAHHNMCAATSTAAPLIETDRSQSRRACKPSCQPPICHTNFPNPFPVLCCNSLRVNTWRIELSELIFGGCTATRIYIFLAKRTEPPSAVSYHWFLPRMAGFVYFFLMRISRFSCFSFFSSCFFSQAAAFSSSGSLKSHPQG